MRPFDPSRLLILTLIVMHGIMATSGLAQAIDPRILQNIQQTLGAAQAASALKEGSPQLQDTPSSIEIQNPGTKVDTPEEQEVRRAEARRQLRTLYDPTSIELEFRKRLNDGSLRQFGYDFFQAGQPPSGVRTGAIGDDYILGIGDEVTVAFRGATNESRTVKVDRDGQLIIGNLRPIRAAGRSLGAIRSEIASVTKQTMLATEAFVSVGDVRFVSVFVGGEVERPGQFNLTSFADVMTAIAQAGGVRRTGSLRQVRVFRASGGSLVVDLYGYLGLGTAPSVRLQDGDRIIVPVIGPTVAISGSVPRPGIYEIKGPTSVATLLEFAGGAVQQRGYEVYLSRVNDRGVDTFDRIPSTQFRLVPGDGVRLVGGAFATAQGRINISGSLANPGQRPLPPGGTLSSLLGSISQLPADTYFPLAMIIRRHPGTGAKQYLPIDLRREFSGFPTVLRNEDTIVVFNQEDIDFLGSGAVRTVAMGGPSPIGNCEGLQRLATLVSSDRASQKYRVRSEVPMQSGTRCPAVFDSEPDLLPVLLERVVLVSGSVRRPGVFPIAVPMPARELADLVEGVSARGVDLVLEINRAVGATFERVTFEEGNPSLGQILIMPGDDVRISSLRSELEVGSVILAGEVFRPGAYTIRQGEKLSELIERAGGLTPFAYPFGAVFLRPSVAEAEQEGFKRTARELNNSLLAVTARSDQKGTEGLTGAAALIQLIADAPATGRMVVEADPKVLAVRPDLDVILEPGDSINIPKRPNYVLALGDVLSPGALQFVNGKSAKAYIESAGGTMSTADEGRIFVVLPNGMAQPLRSGGWASNSQITPPPGSTIVVPKDLTSLYRLQVARDVATIFGQLSLSVATIAALVVN
ncbi:SLBB domain-containing protein [Thermaurantiacus sp.]